LGVCQSSAVHPSFQMRSRRWCGTFFYDDNFLEEWRSTFIEDPHFLYRIAGIEHCPSTGRRHIQFYCETRHPIKKTTVQAVLPDAHCEPARGDAAQNIAYCKKEGDWQEAGTPSPGQGSRSDLKAAVAALASGGITSVVSLYPETFVRYSRGLQELDSRRKRPGIRSLDVHWLHGSTGSGKTHRVYGLEEADQLYRVPSSDLRWFDGYSGEPAVLIDDFRSDGVSFNWLLQLLDKYPLRVPVKGAFVWFQPARIYVTAPQHPLYSFGGHRDEDMRQLLRRITKIWICESIDGVYRVRDDTDSCASP